MGLVEYKKKRSFKKTPEPTGGKGSRTALHFVVQKHAASRLHYDFRLEMDGVLKSWAVPKGPSLNPANKRLAMLVEDHPFDYKDFEGIIPEGNYGAGTVIIWDRGTYEPLETTKTKSAGEKLLLKGLHSGSLKFRLHGEKLQGEFILVKTPGRADNAWLLIKHRDEFATDDDITSEDRSVRSGKTLEELSADQDAEEWKSNQASVKPRKAQAAKKKSAVKKKILKDPVAKSDGLPHSALAAQALKGLTAHKTAPFPENVAPMLATLADKPVDKPGWLYEIKWDGFRAISYLRQNDVDIRSRNNKKFNEKFYPVRQALEEWNISAVVDGEIIVMNEKGYPDFNALQTWRSEADGELVYYLFDILWYNGVDLTNIPLSERRDALKKIIPASGSVRLSENFDVSGSELVALVAKMGLEGILAKKETSFYLPGQRTKDWLKIKAIKQQEVIIGGYTRNENSSRLFSALLLGLYGNGAFEFIGPVGTGFTTGMQKDILKKLKPLETQKCPFAQAPDYNKPSRFRPNPPKAEVTWVRPELVAEVNYRTVASDGTFRHPSFKGLREDKDAKDVIREEPVSAEQAAYENSGKDKPLIATPPKVNGRKSLLNPADETQVRKIDGYDLKFTNLSKVFWPDLNVTKRDMINYYYQVIPYMLPYMKDRPQTLNRFPNGIQGKSFYQKDVSGKVPSWIQTHQYYSEADAREKHFLVITNEASILYVASLGCIEINPWSSRSQTPGHPDWCIIDLDPDKNTFDQVIEAARVTKEILDGMGVPSYCKTSGSTGLHIYIPLGALYTYEESKEFGRAIARRVQEEIPGYTSIERLTSNRKGKMYIDFLQNRPQATVAGPYSLRPKPGAPVSMPLHWDEVRKGLKITDFNIRNSIARLKETGDLFEGVLGKGIDIPKALARLRR
jgi:bifunctional non-homologous end joining protein LigD